MSRTRATAFLAAGLLAQFIYAQTVLQFPADRAVGVVWVREAAHAWEYTFQGWERLAEARGDVAVPAGKQTKLDVGTDNARDLSFLRKLGPDDLYFLQMGAASLGPDRLRDVGGLTGLKVLYLNDTKLKDDDLAAVAGMAGLDELWLGNTGITDAAVDHVRGLKSLKHLTAWNNPVTDGGMKAIAEVRTLEELRLDGCDVSDEGARLIASLPNLKTLSLSETHVGEEGLAALGQSAALREFDLMNVETTPAGLRGLAAAKLELLRMDGKYRVKDDGLKEIGRIVTLERLFLPQGATSDGLRSLLPLKGLRYLYLSADTDDQGLAVLSALPQLEELEVTGSGITDAGVAKLAGSLKLKRLGISYTSATAASLERLATVPTLESFSLGYGNSKLDLAGLKHVASLPHLKRLYLLGTPHVGTDAAEAIGHMGKLEHLQIWCDGLTDPELTSIANARALKFAQFNNSGSAGKFTDAGAKALANLSAVENLTLRGGDLTDASLQVLAKLPNVQYLQVAGNFTDAGLAALEGMPSLHLLTLTGTFSPRAVDRLKQRTPSLQEARVKAGEGGAVGQIQPVAVGQPAPDFDLVALDGRGVSSKAMRGHPVVLYFWATWCAPCVAWTPEIKKLQAELAAKGVEWVSLSLDDMDHQPKRYAEKNGLNWAQIRIGLDSKIADQYGVRGVPTVIVIDANGKVVARDLRSDDAIRKAAGVEEK